MNKKKVVLFRDKTMCCNCKACISICPKDAIKTVINEEGAEYPQIDYDKCISCGMCVAICAYQNQSELAEPKKCFAAATSNKEIIMKSTSGGIATSLTKSILDRGGIAVGCSMEYDGIKWVIHHIPIDNAKDLCKLQGTKYAQSDTKEIYECVKEYLNNGKKILFIGTPCQVAEIKRYFRNIDCKNLYTIDIICHGVPSSKMFYDYINMLEKKHGARIIKFSFRDKSIGWGLYGGYTLKKRTGKTKKIFFNAGVSSYYNYFLTSEIYRKNCYSCPYACAERAGDITIGDFWGIEKEYPEYLKENGGVFNVHDGISCVLVNTKKGELMLDEYGDGLTLKNVKFSQISKHNNQLNKPSKEENKLRNYLMDLYIKKGYLGIDNHFRKKLGFKYYIRKVRNKTQEIIKYLK